MNASNLSANAPSTSSEKDLAKAINAHFDRLQEIIEKRVGELRILFFDSLMHAAIGINGGGNLDGESSLMTIDHFGEVQEAINVGAKGVGSRVLSSSCLNKALASTNAGRLDNVALNRTLTMLGWTKLPKKLKWRGAAHWIWTRGHFHSSTHALRLELDRTMTISADPRTDSLFGDLLAD